MKTALIVTSSANGDASISNGLATTLADRLRESDPGLHIVLRDVGANPVPHLTNATVAAIKGTPESAAELAARALSDALIEELAAAEILVIASPMYNFGMSSTLKAWFDHVLRVGVTVRYGENGPEGLMTGKKAVVIESRGGLYSDGPGAALDGQEAHIRTLLGYIGITDVTFVRAEKLGYGPAAAEAAIAEASEALGAFAGEALKLAA
jgi:FMN-dependent NADH-azoreductase